MAKGVQGDGVWFEGAWGYHLYTLNALWPLTEAARNSGIDLYGEPLKKMFEAPIQLAMPNLMLPAFNDSTESPVRNNLYELAYARYRDPLYLRRPHRREPRGTSTRSGSASIAIPAEAARRRWRAATRWTPDTRFSREGGTWLCLKYGPHGGGHGHPDKNNFILFGGGHVLFPDPGTRPYGSPLHTEWDRATIAHNTLVVDGASQAPATGKSLAFGPNYAMTDAGAIYPGVRFVRTAAMLSGEPDRVRRPRHRGSPAHLRSGRPLRGRVEGSAGRAKRSRLAYKYVEDATTRRAVALCAPDTLAVFARRQRAHGNDHRDRARQEHRRAHPDEHLPPHGRNRRPSSGRCLSTAPR